MPLGGVFLVGGRDMRHEQVALPEVLSTPDLGSH